MTRIALVSGGIGLGGSTTFLVNLAGDLARRKIPVEVLSFEKNNPLASDFQRLNVPVLCLDARRGIFEDRMEMILRRLSEFKPTVVVANLGAVSFEVFRYTPPGVFRLGVGHADDPKVYEMLGHFVPHMDALAVVSDKMKEHLSALLEFSRLPVHYLAHGVPMPLDTELPVRTFASPLRLIYLGRLEREQKRVHLFPQILEQLKASGVPFHWTIAGEGSQKTALERTMKSSPGQTVSFPGQISYAQVPEILRSHDVCLLTSDYEGFGLSVAEAMGCGLVPVVSDLPAGIPEMVDHTTGIVVPMDDVAGYARGILHLHEHRDELAAKSAAARVRVKTRFSLAAMTDRWLAVMPAPPPVMSQWPARWNISAPLEVKNSFYYSRPMRVLRRMAGSLRR